MPRTSAWEEKKEGAGLRRRKQQGEVATAGRDVSKDGDHFQILRRDTELRRAVCV